MSGPTVLGQSVNIGDNLYMVTAGLMVSVVDVSATKFNVRYPNGRTALYNTEPKVGATQTPLFHWEDISKVKTVKGGDVVRRLNLFTELTNELQKGKV